MADSSTLVDRVKIFVESSGTGPFQLGNAVPAFRGSEALIDGLTYSYAVESGSDYEVGQGVYVLAVDQLLRAPTLSSAGGAPVSFPANVTINFTALAADLTAGLAGTGTVTSIQGSGGTTGMTLTGGPITGAGTLTLGGTLGLANGGTGGTTAEEARDGLELGNVDNTSDADKPISTDTQAALDAKVAIADLIAPTGGGLVGLQPSGGNTTTLEDTIDILPVFIENYATFQAAFDAAVSRGAPLHFRPGVTYNWPATTVTVSGRVKVVAIGANIVVVDAITALTLSTGADGSEWDGGYWSYTGPKTDGYNAGSNAILVTGTHNGAAVAPTFIQNVRIKNATFDGFGNTAVEWRFAKNCEDENLRVLNGGYSGVFCYSVDRYRSSSLYVNTLAGQLDTGNPVTSELNAYGFTATALTGGTPNRVGDPISRDIIVDSPTMINIPTWHAIDTHGADRMIVKNATIIDCRRGIVFTGLSDRGASNCLAWGCTATNNFAASATNANTSFKKGEAFWDVGVSTSLRNSFNRFEACTSFGHGNPNAGAGGGFANSGDGAVTIADANDGFYEISDVQSLFIGWKFGANILRATIKARSTNTHHATANPSVARIEGNDINLRIADWQADAKDAAVDTNVMVNGVVVVNTNTGGSIHFEKFNLTACTNGELLANSGNVIAASLTGNYSFVYDVTMTGVVTPPTIGVRIERQERLCSAQIPIGSFTGTSNATTLTLTGIPENFRPSTTRAAGTISALDGGANFVLAYGIIDNTGVITLTRDADNNTSNWANSGTKRLRGGILQWMVE